MKILCILPYLILLVNSCRAKPELWKGPELIRPLNQLTSKHLLGDSPLPLLDMSFFARPEWAQPASCHFSGAISFRNTEMIYPADRKYFPGENIFPGITLDFICHDGELIPVRNEIVTNGLSPESS
jgi:hypothetical protein